MARSKRYRTDLERVDVFFNLDTTGPMAGEVAAFKTNLNAGIVTPIDAYVDDAAFATQG